ncbi:MAG: hypothetical protein P1P77_18165 [Spirochaetaceae bacterium]|nr:hypothetical protein [Spirochaetaceae bacterium]
MNTAEDQVYALARSGLIIALITTAALLVFVNRSLWVYLGGLYLLSAFFQQILHRSTD